MSDPKLKIVITADGKQYAAEIDRASGKTRTLGKEAKASAAEVSQLARAMQIARRAVAGYVSYKAAQQFAETALAAEALANKLTFATGSTQQAAQEIAWLREETERLGLEFFATADAYGGLAAAARGTVLEGQATRDVFLGVAEAAAALSLSADQNNGALLALSQMISKGIVQAEELRGQLGERIPGAFQIAARAIGVTTDELSDMLQKGEVVATDFLPRFAAEMRRTFGPSAEAAAAGFRGQINRLSNAWNQLLIEIGNTGAIDAAATALGSLASGINDLVDPMDRLLASYERISRRKGHRGRGARGRKQGALASLAEQINDELIERGGPVGLRIEIQRAEDEIRGLDADIERYQQAVAEAQAKLAAMPAGPLSVGAGRNRRLTERGEVAAELQRANDALEAAVRQREEAARRMADANAALEAAELQMPGGGDQGQGPGKADQAAQDDREALRQAAEQYIETLRREAAMYGETSKAAEAYFETIQGRFAGLDEQTRKRITAAAEEADAERKLAEELDRAAAEMDAMVAAVDRMEKSDADLIQRLEEELRLRQMSDRQRAIEITLRKLSAAATDEERRRVIELTGAIYDLEQSGTDGFSALEDAVRGFGDQLRDAIVDGVMEGKLALDDLLEYAIRTFLEIQVQSAIIDPLVSASSSFDWGAFFASMFSFGTAHTGGVIGGDTLTTKYVHPAVFADAPRFHTGGLVGGEVPIIAKEGEGVFTPEQMRALAPVERVQQVIAQTSGEQVQTPVKINIINNAAGTEVRQQTRQGAGGLELDVIIDQVESELIRRTMMGGGLTPLMRNNGGGAY